MPEAMVYVLFVITENGEQISAKKRGEKMSNKRFKAVNKIAVYFTEQQIGFLNRMSEDLGEGKSTIIRRAVNEFMYRENKKRGEE